MTKHRFNLIVTIGFALVGLVVIGPQHARADTITALTVSSGPSIQQIDNRPCIIGDPSCHNPDSFSYTLLDPGKKGESGTVSSPTYTVDQLRSILGGDTFFVGIDLNQAMGHNDGAYTLSSFTLKVDGTVMFSTTGTNTLYPLNPGNGYSDASIATFSLAGLSGSQKLVFTTIFSGATAGREQYFVIPRLSGPGGGGGTGGQMPEPATLLLLGTGLAGIVLKRRAH